MSFVSFMLIQRLKCFVFGNVIHVVWLVRSRVICVVILAFMDGIVVQVFVSSLLTICGRVVRFETLTWIIILGQFNLWVKRVCLIVCMGQFVKRELVFIEPCISLHNYLLVFHVVNFVTFCSLWVSQEHSWSPPYFKLISFGKGASILGETAKNLHIIIILFWLNRIS